MKKITLLLAFVCLGFATGTLAAQDFSANAKAEMAKNNFLPAIDELTAFLQTSPDSEILLTYRGNFYTKAGQNEKAIADATKVMGINPKSTNGLMTLGTAKMALGKTQEAIDHLTQALAIQPNLKPALIMRSKAYFKVKQPEKSMADLSFAIQDDPKNLEAYVYRGQLYTALKQFDSAKSDYQYILKNAVAGDRYYEAATQKMTEMQQNEAQTKMAESKKAEDDAYAKKLTDQVTAMSKEVGETTSRIIKMLTGYTTELNAFIQKTEAIPKSKWQEKATLYEEINPRIKQYLVNIQKERAKIVGKDVYKEMVTNIDGTVSALNVIIERTSPYAVRRLEYVETVNALDAEITTYFNNMLAAQKSSNEAEFERNKILAVGKTKNLLISVNESREALRQLDATQYRDKDESKFTKVLADYTRTLANINGINY